MDTRSFIEQVIERLEAHRSILGDEATDTAVAALREKLVAPIASPVCPPVSTDPPSPSEDRKVVTVMFADISGYTQLSERHDPEHVRDLINRCFERLTPIIGRYDGTVDKFIGDEIMAVFGAPVSHEDDPARAVRSALDMMVAIAEFNAANGTDLGMHVGINTGTVVAGSVGSGGRGAYSVMGDAVNLAARLRDAARPGEIVAGPETLHETQDRFHFAPLQPIRVKGKSELIRAARVQGPKENSGRPRTSWSRLSARMVGRERELSELLDALANMLNGTGQIVHLVGEAGIGKSRLVAEFRAYAESRRSAHEWVWLEGRAISFGQDLSFRPFQEILRQAVGIAEEHDDHDAWNILEEALTRMFGDETPDVLPYLARVLSLQAPVEYAARTQYLGGEAMGRRVFFSMRRYFARYAMEQPFVLVLEDVQWADTSSLLLLEHLIPLVEEASILFVVVNRPGHATSTSPFHSEAVQRYDGHYREIHLQSLSATHSLELIRDLLDTSLLPDELIEGILERADGNPLYLEEIVRSMIDQEKLVRDGRGQRWTPTTDVGMFRIPGSIQALVMARVDRLNDEARRVLRMAAVVGRTFLPQVLRSMDETDGHIEQHLVELRSLDLIEEKRAEPELEYMFKHALVHQVTYESILLRTRRELHLKAARVMERIFEERLEEVYSPLAFHYAKADAWEKAFGFLVRAGDQAGRVAADAEALAHYRQAVKLLREMPIEPLDDLQWAALERKIGEALYRRGEHPQAMKHLHRALAYLGSPWPRSGWREGVAIARELLVQVMHRLTRAPGQTGDGMASRKVQERFLAYEAIGWIAAFGNYRRFLLMALLVVNSSERSRHLVGMAKGYAALGTVCDVVPLPRLAVLYHERCRYYTQRLANPDLTGLSHTGRMVHHVCAARWEEALEHAQWAMEAYEGIGNIRSWGYALYMKAVCWAYMARLAEADDACAHLIGVARDAADAQLASWGRGTRGFVLRRQGRWEEAAGELRLAAEVARSIDDHVVHMWSLAELGRSLLFQGHTDAALAALEQSRQVRRDYRHIRLIWVQVDAAVAEGYLTATENAGTREAGHFRREARLACRSSLRNARSFRCLMPEAALHMGSLCWLEGRPARARRWWSRSLSEAVETGQRLDEAWTLLEMATRLGTEEYRSRYEALFRETGVTQTASHRVDIAHDRGPWAGG